MIDRRTLLRGAALGGAGLALSACASTGPQSRLGSSGPIGFASYKEMYGPITDEPFPLPAVNLAQVKSRFYRRRVRNPTGEAPGSLIVDTRRFYLYWVEEGGTAMRYGVGLGRAGFDWSGRGVIQFKRRWPTWTPPAEMIARDPKLAKYSAANGGMKPGPLNPLGARALYIFQDGVDTLYRVHGSPEASSIGRAVSSGCVRLLNHDIIDLYSRVTTGGPILVR
jgi:lipoprotein-anchoring transpeptidase ErfK/SrfK